MINNENEKDLRKVLVRSVDNINGVFTKLERTVFLLNELLDDYTFTEKPNPALLYGNIKEENLAERRQAAEWLHGYDRIHQFVNMALEFAFYGKEDLGKMLNVLEDELETLKQEAV